VTILRHETALDRAWQKAICRAVARARGLRQQGMVRFCPFDALLIDAGGEHVVGCVEVKQRTCTVDAYPTCFAEVPKLQALLDAAIAFGLPARWQALFAVRWSDGVIGVVPAAVAQTYPVREVTLLRPRDHGDVDDPCHLVPIEAFTRLAGVEGIRAVIDPDEDWELTP
jgi:hypothetical protein